MMQRCANRPIARSRRTAVHPGFTLIELLVVLVIIGILAGILFPAFAGVQRSGRETATRGSMTAVLNACGTFQTDQRRLPGYFSQDLMGSADNVSRGFTQMENALLDLMGGPVTTAAGGSVITVGPSSSTPDGEVNVNLGLMGAADGPGYLSLPSEQFAAVEGQATTSDMQRMPDVIDAFGNPIMMWTRNENASTSGALAAIQAPANPNQPRAKFYWAPQAGYVSASALGDKKYDQANNSLLSRSGSIFPNTPSSDNEIVLSIEAVVGHPDFPSTADLSRPASPRGDIVLHSGGNDGFFLANDEGDFDNARYLRTGTVPGNQRIIDKFDDIFAAR